RRLPLTRFLWRGEPSRVLVTPVHSLMVLGHDRVELATRDAQSPHHDGNKHDDQGHTDDECDHAVPLSVRAPLPALLYLADRSRAWDVTGSCDRPAGSPDQRLGSNDAS